MHKKKKLLTLSMLSLSYREKYFKKSSRIKTIL